MLKTLDNYLGKVTMYRLTLYGLSFLLFIGIFIKGPILIFSTFFILVTAYLFNILFSEAFEVAVNPESFIITSLILTLIVSPPKSMSDLIFIFWVTVLAISSKFIIVYKNKHIFNPVAIAVILTSILIGSSANWWVGNTQMLIPTSVIGFLIIRKLKRGNLFMSFIASTFIVSILINLFKGFSISNLFVRTLEETPLIFFATIMLTEPLTLPPTKKLKIIYGIMAGFFFSPQFRIFGYAPTPEIALIIANIFSFIISFKERIIFKLSEKIKIANGTYDFLLEPNSKFIFLPGQYMEFTLGHEKVDSRGIRRYFSIASSPTEEKTRLGVKFYQENPSSFKKRMLEMNLNDVITASNIDGDFTMPTDLNIKLAFFAGGIGITPFRSMVKNMIDLNQKRDIVLIYSNKDENEIAYKEVFDLAYQQFGMKSYYVDTDYIGRVDAQIITRDIPDWNERLFYISGPHTMVTSFEDILKSIGVKKNKIVVDYFPGF